MKELLAKAQELKRLIALENQHYHSATIQRRKINEIEEIYKRISRLQAELHNIYKLIDFREMHINTKNNLQN